MWRIVLLALISLTGCDQPAVFDSGLGVFNPNASSPAHDLADREWRVTIQAITDGVAGSEVVIRADGVAIVTPGGRGASEAAPPRRVKLAVDRMAMLTSLLESRAFTDLPPEQRAEGAGGLVIMVTLHVDGSTARSVRCDSVAPPVIKELYTFAWNVAQESRLAVNPDAGERS